MMYQSKYYQPINWKATQELNEKVENMQSTIEQLQNKVNELEKLIEKEK